MKKYEYIYAYQIGGYPDWEIVELIKNDNKISESGLIIAKEDKIINDKGQEIKRLKNIIDELEKDLTKVLEDMYNSLVHINGRGYYSASLVPLEDELNKLKELKGDKE